MKKLRPFLLVLIVLMVQSLFTACHSYDSPIDGKKIDDMTFGPEQSYQVVQLRNDDSSNLTLVSSENWCVASVRGDTLRVAVTENTTYSERTATVDIKDSEDGSHVSFKVIQEQNKAIRIVNSKIEVPEEGGSFTIDFKSNLKWEILPLVDWIHAGTRGTRALEDCSAEVFVDPNDSGDPREGVVKIKDSESGWYNEVTVAQSFSYYIKIDPDAVNINEKGGEIEVTMQANTSFNVEFTNQNPTKWLEEGARTKIGDNKYKQIIKVSALPAETSNRYSEVFFTHYLNERPVYYRVLVVNQVKSE